MSAKNFRFRSPGIRIQEIDQSFVEAPTVSEVGPVIVGRSLEGPILKPVTVNSVAEFIDGIVTFFNELHTPNIVEKVVQESNDVGRETVLKFSHD